MKAYALTLLAAGLLSGCQKPLSSLPNGGRTPLADVPVGSWAEYRLTTPLNASLVVTAVVERNTQGTVVETTVTDAVPHEGAAPVVDRQLYAPKDDLGAKPLAAAVQVASYEPMVKDQAEAQGNIDLSKLSARDALGRESITVPAGTFQSLHYDTKTTTGDAVEIWVSEKLPPTGIVKMLWRPAAATQAGASSMEALRVGSGATPKIKAQPKPFDREEMLHQLISIAGGPAPQPH